MFHRELHSEILQMAKDYPVVTLLGPRQSGKTTLVKEAFKNKPYANLELPETRILAKEDPNGFMEQYPQGALLDEIQHVPELLSYIQVNVDEHPKKGKFILTGSHQLELHQAISQSLAGRTALLHLLPLSISELASANVQQTDDEYLLKGFYPRIYQDNLDPTKAYRNYFQTYIEKDLRSLINIKELSTFQRFIKLTAGRVGQVVNFANLSNEVGVSAPTIHHWLSILEASYIIVRLQPYFENFGKRIIKSAKLYFTDVGLATYLLGIKSKQQLVRDPLRGQLFENMVVLELMKYQYNRGLEPELYFYRDNNGHEIDVIIRDGHMLVPVEIKSGKTFQTSFLKNLHFYQGLVGNRCQTGFVIYAGNKQQKLGDFRLLNYLNSYQVFQ